MKTKLLRKIREDHRIMTDNKNQYYYVRMGFSSTWGKAIRFIEGMRCLEDAIKRQHISMSVQLEERKYKKLVQISLKNKSK